uniref:Uncharacterized protein n=1 Tax=Leptospirillum ferrodiazotrophum TaxID=412449 RepID=C6HYM7_9BACT|nr:MAG: hypothetical protein UBAL3_94240105 [Leptospirillum ferrodiazotrophum]
MRSSWEGGQHCLMSPEEARAFLSPRLEKAREGGIITVPPLHEALELKLGQKTPSATKHPKIQPEEKEFKTLPETLAATLITRPDSSPVRLLFQDEARFGRMTDPRAFWATAPSAQSFLCPWCGNSSMNMRP